MPTTIGQLSFINIDVDYRLESLVSIATIDDVKH